MYRQTLHASIASVQDSPRFHFELLNFDLYTDLDPVFHCNADPDPDLEQATYPINADPDPDLDQVS